METRNWRLIVIASIFATIALVVDTLTGGPRTGGTTVVMVVLTILTSLGIAKIERED